MALLFFFLKNTVKDGIFHQGLEDDLRNHAVKDFRGYILDIRQFSRITNILDPDIIADMVQFLFQSQGILPFI